MVVVDFSFSGRCFQFNLAVLGGQKPSNPPKLGQINFLDLIFFNAN